MVGVTRYSESSVLALALVVSCGGETATAGGAKLDEVCGEAGAFQILALEDRPPITGWESETVAGRRIVGVRYAAEEGEERREELWSVGPCGADPILLLEGSSRWRVYEELWPEVLQVADRDAGKVLAVDPLGVREPNAFADILVDYRWTPHGRLGLIPTGDVELLSVALQPWPEDPWTGMAQSVVLLEDVPFPPLTWGSGDDAYVLDQSNDLLHVSLVDHSVETIASNVRDYDVDWDAPYVHFRHLPPPQDPDASTGTVALWHKETGETMEVTTEGRSPGIVIRSAPDRDVMLLRVGPDDAWTRELYQLPSLEHTTYDEGLGLILEYLGDGRILGRESPFAWGPYVLLDTETGELTTLIDAEGYSSIGDEALYVADGLDINSDDPADFVGTLLRAWYADGSIETLAERVTSCWVRLGDDRIVTPVDIGENKVGELVVVEPGTLAEQSIEARVRCLERDDQDDSTVIYAVPDGDRAGIWLAKPAP